MITATGLFDGIVTMSGTSLSTAIVTASAAYIWAKDTSKSPDYIRRIIRETGRDVSNAKEYGAKQIDVSKAVEVYTDFENTYVEDLGQRSNEMRNDTPVEDFSDVQLVNGLWESSKHEKIVYDYLAKEGVLDEEAYERLKINPETMKSDRVTIMAIMAREADKTYGGSNSDGGSALHATGLYKQAMKYLFNCAQFLREGKSIEEASDTALKTIKGNFAMSDTGKTLIAQTKNMLNRDFTGISGNKNNNAVRYFKTMGFALHCIQDVFAHRAIVSSSDEVKGYKENHFSSNGIKYIEENLGEIEYRELKDYRNKSIDKQHNGTYYWHTKLYEDNVELGAPRFKDAKVQSKLMLNASLLKTGFDINWFSSPYYGTKLGNESN